MIYDNSSLAPIFNLDSLTNATVASTFANCSNNMLHSLYNLTVGNITGTNASYSFDQFENMTLIQLVNATPIDNLFW